MIKIKVLSLEGRLLFSQSEQFVKFLKSTDLLEKSRPSKKATFGLSCKQANTVLKVELGEFQIYFRKIPLHQQNFLVVSVLSNFHFGHFSNISTTKAN